MMANPLVVEMRNFEKDIARFKAEMGVEEEQDEQEMNALDIERQRLTEAINSNRDALHKLRLEKKPQRSNIAELSNENSSLLRNDRDSASQPLSFDFESENSSAMGAKKGLSGRSGRKKKDLD